MNLQISSQNTCKLPYPLKGNLSSTQFSFSHRVTSILLDRFWMNVFFHCKGLLEISTDVLGKSQANI